jgi:hypothetical protein
MSPEYLSPGVYVEEVDRGPSLLKVRVLPVPPSSVLLKKDLSISLYSYPTGPSLSTTSADLLRASIWLPRFTAISRTAEADATFPGFPAEKRPVQPSRRRFTQPCPAVY